MTPEERALIMIFFDRRNAERSRDASERASARALCVRQRCYSLVQRAVA